MLSHSMIIMEHSRSYVVTWRTISGRPCLHRIMRATLPSFMQCLRHSSGSGGVLPSARLNLAISVTRGLPETTGPGNSRMTMQSCLLFFVDRFLGQKKCCGLIA